MVLDFLFSLICYKCDKNVIHSFSLKVCKLVKAFCEDWYDCWNVQSLKMATKDCYAFLHFLLYTHCITAAGVNAILTMTQANIRSYYTVCISSFIAVNLQRIHLLDFTLKCEGIECLSIFNLDWNWFY